MIENLVIGLGNIGSATMKFLEHYGYEVEGYDVFKKKRTVDEVVESDTYWICTPESSVHDVLEDIDGYEGLVIVRSTTLVGKVESYSDEFDRHIVHAPSFVREDHAYEDMIDCEHFLIGECCDNHGELVSDIFEKNGSDVIRVPPSESEMVKLATNSFLATLISFWNDISLVCDELDLDSDRIANIASQRDGRVPKYGARWTGEPFGGDCLPKDLRHLVDISKKNGYSPKILESAIEVNNSLKEVQ